MSTGPHNIAGNSANLLDLFQKIGQNIGGSTQLGPMSTPAPLPSGPPPVQQGTGSAQGSVPPPNSDVAPPPPNNMQQPLEGLQAPVIAFSGAEIQSMDMPMEQTQQPAPAPSNSATNAQTQAAKPNISAAVTSALIGEIIDKLGNQQQAPSKASDSTTPLKEAPVATQMPASEEAPPPQPTLAAFQTVNREGETPLSLLAQRMLDAAGLQPRQSLASQDAKETKFADVVPLTKGQEEQQAKSLQTANPVVSKEGADTTQMRMQQQEPATKSEKVTERAADQVSGEALKELKESTVTSLKNAIKTLGAELPTGQTTQMQTERSGIIASFILNAAMIPGWPPPHLIEISKGDATNHLTQLFAQMNETDIADYLVKAGVHEHLLKKMHKAMQKGGIRKKLLMCLAVFVTSIKVVVDTLQEELEALIAGQSSLQTMGEHVEGNAEQKGKYYYTN